MRMCADLAITTNFVRKAMLFLPMLVLLSIAVSISGCSKPHQIAGPPRHLTHIYGQLLDSGGRPVAQYPMKLDPVEASSQSFSAVTDYSGVFEFADVPKGTYIVHPVNRAAEGGKTIRIQGESTESIGQIEFRGNIAVDLNTAAAPVINDQAKQTINPEAARTINPDAAKTINPGAARMINPAAARTINSAAARSINPAAARVLNPERAKTLTEQQAKELTVERAKEPPQ